MMSKPWMAFVAGVLAALSLQADAAERDGGRTGRGWTAYVDNDLFALAERDRDYTAGLALSLSGSAARDHVLSLAAPLRALDRLTRGGGLGRHGEVEGHGLEVGLTLFSPQDLSARAPLRDDRPYANLLYVSSSMLRHDASRGVAVQSSLTLGVIGLPVAKELHEAVHRVFGSERPMGYANQISDGGEPTMRYAVSRYRLLGTARIADRPVTLSYGVEGSAGYLTEIGASLAVRWGAAGVPWWSPLSVSGGYAGHPPIRTPSHADVSGRADVAIDAGIRVRARLYNSFLQGQFRDSAVTYSGRDLEHGLLEVWFGVTTLLPNDVRVSYTVQYQSPEIEHGPAARGLTWAGIGVARSF